MISILEVLLLFYALIDSAAIVIEFKNRNWSRCLQIPEQKNYLLRISYPEMGKKYMSKK